MSGLSRLNHRLFDDINTFARNTGWLHTPLVDYAKDGVVLFGLLLILGLIYSRRGSARTLAAAGWACIAVLIAVAVNQPIVHAAHEARPYTGHPNVLVLVARSADLSFPSDHSVMAGATAAGILLFSRKIGLVAVVAALLMAFARVYVGAHYPGDVLAGLVIGAAVAVLGWLLVRVPLTRAAAWLRDQPRLQPLLVAKTGHTDIAAASGSDARP
jgi:membrane-associated phospholipid phosphatase